MPVRKADVLWEGTNTEGKGTISFGSVALPYTRASRFEEAAGSNPEELLAAAHASCFSLALAGNLTRAEFPPKALHTSAEVSIEKGAEGFKITRIVLSVEAEVPGINPDLFMEKAESAKRTCPVSMALAGVDEIVLSAKLKS
jgi:osmotically inducible protein OsmC